jgi:beta-lactamase superfamily II metal-dependent hydrolase
MATPMRIHLVDVGDREYGECLLVEAGGKRILIDGAHQGDAAPQGTYPGIAQQLRDLTGSGGKVAIDLLVLSHAHADHVGSLPDLVPDVIDVEWALLPDHELSWGRPLGAPPPDLPDTVRAAVAGLREEVPSAETLADPARLDLFLADAVTLEDRYKQLVAGLEGEGANIVYHGRDDESALLSAFATIGLEILGPSQAQLLLTAELIRLAIDSIAQDAMAIVDRRADARGDAKTLYRSLLGTAADAADAKSRPGNLVNLQSTALTLRQGSRRAFFAGDMELADPESSNAALRTEVSALRGRMRQRRPYAYAQCGHHGSANASNAGTLEDLGKPKLVGMSAGRASDKHPASSVMAAAAAAGAHWVRTDRNGLVTIEARKSGPGWTVKPARGVADDPTPPGADARTAAPPSVMLEPGGSVTRIPGVPTSTTVSGDVEVTIRTSRPVRVTIALEDAVGGPGVPTVVTGRPDTQPLVVGGGRPLPSLLYVTDPSLLARNVGSAEGAQVMNALRAANGSVLEVDGSTGTGPIRQRVAENLGTGAFAGVVLVGGYDVVPPEVVDTLPASLSASVDRGGDADHFIVWSDDQYAQRPGVGALPISRVADGHRADVLFAGLGTPVSRTVTANGVRNIARPFAEAVYGTLTGGSPLLISEPALVADARGRLGGDTLYYMLHGYWRDATRFWGEQNGEFPEAVNLTCVEGRAGTVVFSGACWGALIVDTQAMQAAANVPIGSRGPGESIAIAYLAGGANAFVGCTGSHYSPSLPPYRSAGAPIHTSFFSYLSTGKRPAAALAQAKRDYVAAMPHSEGPAALAIEHKILWQFTCLGLGW